VAFKRRDEFGGDEIRTVASGAMRTIWTKIAVGK
jgi:hypothetical protein